LINPERHHDRPSHRLSWPRTTGRSLKTVLLAAIASLSFLLVIAFGQQSLSAWSAYSRVSRVQEFDAAANKFIAGLFEVLLERLYTNKPNTFYLFIINVLTSV
jgi:hypothetical protein